MASEEGVGVGESVQDQVEAYLKVLTHERQLSDHTVAAYRRDLKDLSAFLTEYLGTPDWEWDGGGPPDPPEFPGVVSSPGPVPPDHRPEALCHPGFLPVPPS